MSIKSSRSVPDKPKLLDEFHNVMRRRHYSIHTERSYVDWIKRYIHFYKMQERRELLAGKDQKVEDFLSHLAVHGNVAPATQNQALNALVFLYRHVLKEPLGDSLRAERAKKKIRIPVVMTRDEVSQVISVMNGVPQLIVKLLYGSGLRVAAGWYQQADHSPYLSTQFRYPSLAEGDGYSDYSGVAGAQRCKNNGNLYAYH